jgi:hypothetical protein
MVGCDGRQPAAGAEGGGGLGDPDRRVDPVERGRRQDQVERLGGERPALEGGGDDLDRREPGQVAAGDGRQLGAELHGHDPAAPLGQRDGRLPGPRADLQHPRAGADTR